jgi:hypothetical protein
VRDLAVDYAALLAGLDPDAGIDDVGAALLDAVGSRYEDAVGRCQLLLFEQSGAHFLFDLASSSGLPQADRTVAAYALTPASVAGRDASYQRGFPMQPASDSDPVDRGHLIPRLSGGEYGPNIFHQDRALNRGHSKEGKRYRALERRAAAALGALYFGHLLYDDDTDHPSEVETGWVHGGAFEFERFDNRPSAR